MFDPSKPRIFGIPSGSDFPKVLVEGLMQRHGDAPPEDLARATLMVNTRRMARRIRDLFDAGPALLLPRIGLVTDPAMGRVLPDIPDAVSPLRRRLEVAQLVSRLLDSQPDLAPRASLYDLSDSLAALMDEMQGEGVAPDVLRNLDVSDESGHWKRALNFLDIVQHYFEDSIDAPDSETRARMIVTALTGDWAANPPQTPLIVAGSTGSRGTTMLLMKAVAKLPQGAIVLPGFDFDMPLSGWDDLDDALAAEDHPQYRFRKLMNELGIGPQDVQPWTDTPAPCPPRNRLLSLALRPAPVTDRWLEEGPQLQDLDQACADLTVIEAQSQRDEALAIALRLRRAADEGITAALITPDRMLTRQVTSALDRWGIVPDDSAGTPLQLSPPGRFLRHVSALFHRKLTSESLLTLLMHPLTHSGGERGPHLLLTRELELHIRRTGMPFPDPVQMRAWAAVIDRPMAVAWMEWLIENFIDKDTGGEIALTDHVERHMILAEAIANGSAPSGDSALWSGDSGLAAQGVVATLSGEAEHGGILSASDYADMFGAILSQGEVRNPDEPHPKILIWGTLEARVQGADLVILGGLNEGSWPEMPNPDPWLNRRMRHDAGLLLPERRIGLSAHDFQQAAGAPQVWMTRSVRSDDAETVPSRWLNRMTNLLNGLPGQGGDVALAGARARGDEWLALARKLEEPGTTPAAPRPSPRPPVASRPNRLSVTEIKRLIRDPYAIYARHVLRLRPLDPLMRAPDALLRGIVTHSVLERFIHECRADPAALTAQRLNEIADTVLAQNVPWPDIRALWAARIGRIADWFVASEKERQARAVPTYFEEKGEVGIDGIDFTLVGKADRIDMDDMGRAHIYDYKTGAPPSAKQQRIFDKQLLLEAAMISRGGFPDIGLADVAEATFIGLGSKPAEVAAPLEDEPVEQVWDKFETLIQSYFQPEQGYTARRALFKDSDISDYDQLSRFGEWDVTSEPEPEDLS
ncbi:double-strand break repair protein AddB [Thalassovita mangrovi]|uniref:Double-strand break repair protein AddB n=1 Tax=Thalassovita mangrovi TaxID=2692236 RepID=A0A6L8LQ96_9RHOB|nr:double-strand break repair protein AddB [Thalassovita mangrovi]MYM55339.1 double-strand break repair protein AddB [Thalassovita mangrovi]